jgi:hypothetical protein
MEEIVQVAVVMPETQEMAGTAPAMRVMPVTDPAAVAIGQALAEIAQVPAAALPLRYPVRWLIRRDGDPIEIA